MRILLLILSAWICAVANAAPAPQLRARVDAWLEERLPLIIARQEAYKAAHGSYWQGLITHAQPPAHSNAADHDAAADRLNLHPSDQTATWSDVFPEFVGMPFPAALQMDVYGGPDGQGWVIRVIMKQGQNTHKRSRNFGPETHKEEAWHTL